VRRGTTHPQRTSWFVFATVSIVACVSQLAAGVDAGAWLAAGSALGFTAVFVASIRRGVGGWSHLDRMVLVIALVGVAISVAVDRPLVAVVAIVVAEAVAVSLTVRKAVADPASETASTWLLDLGAGAVAVAAVTHPSAGELLYPVHHTLANAAVVVAIGVGRSRPSAAGSAAAPLAG
jgi:hypothetical protein